MNWNSSKKTASVFKRRKSRSTVADFWKYQRGLLKQKGKTNGTDTIMQLQRHEVVRSGQLKKFSGLKIRDGILYRRSRIVVPTSLKEEVLEMVHRTYHGGVKRTIDELKLSDFTGEECMQILRVFARDAWSI